MQASSLSASLEAHRSELLLRRRCGDCAERVPAGAVLGGGTCPSCASEITFVTADNVEERINQMLGRWGARRWVIYGLTALGALLTGFFPLAASLVTLVALLVMRHAVLRGALGWLGPKRRMATKMMLRQWMVLVALAGLLADQLLRLIPIGGIFGKMAVALALAVLFLESSLRFAAGRIRREVRGAALDSWEWALPLALVVLMVLAALAVMAVGMWVIGLLGSSMTWLMGLIGAGS